jgi:4-hydroxy-tetrahydrodipicolinate reductase
MIEVIIAGAAGRMGKRLVRAAAASDEVVIGAAFERESHPLVGEDVGVAAGIGALGVSISASLHDTGFNGQVLIDFTVPEASMKNLHEATGKGVAAVIGTTGFSSEMLADIRKMSGRISCVMSPNMSVGMNIMFKTAGKLAATLGHGYDLEIVETHHRLKKDAPSGTAVRLAEVLADATGRNIDEAAVYARKGIIGARSDKEIGIQSLRGGDVTGEHTVLFLGNGERLELTHRAHNRDNFAHGALRAAVWVVDRPAGLYDMQDVLGLRDL